MNIYVALGIGEMIHIFHSNVIEKLNSTSDYKI